MLEAGIGRLIMLLLAILMVGGVSRRLVLVEGRLRMVRLRDGRHLTQVLLLDMGFLLDRGQLLGHCAHAREDAIRFWGQWGLLKDASSDADGRLRADEDARRGE